MINEDQYQIPEAEDVDIDTTYSLRPSNGYLDTRYNTSAIPENSISQEQATNALNLMEDIFKKFRK